MGWLSPLPGWIIAVCIALLSGWLFQSDNLLVMFLGFVLFVSSATLAGYQVQTTSPTKMRPSPSILSSLSRGAMGIGAVLMCIPAFIGYVFL